MTGRLHFLVLLAVVPPAIAQTPLTLEAAVGQALRTHPEIAAARASVAVTTAEALLAGALPQPEFRWTSNNLGIDPETAALRTSLGIRYSPMRPGERRWKLRAARAREYSSGAIIRAAEIRVAAETRRLYRRAVTLEERARLARRAVEIRAAILDTVRKQTSAGLKDAMEADLAELALAEARQESARLDGLARKELAALQRFSGIEDRRPMLSPLEALALETPAAADTAAWTRRPERIEFEGACEEARAAERLARNQSYPWLKFVQVNRRVDTLFGENPLANVSNSNHGWGVQLGIELPLFRTAASAERKIAAAERSRCTSRLDAARWRVSREVEAAASDLEQSARELAELERLATGPAARIVHRLKSALAEGRADLAEVLQAEARQHSLREKWLDRRLDHAQLQYLFELASGL